MLPTSLPHLELPCFDQLDDIQGSLVDPELVFFTAGNHHFVWPELFAAFSELGPDWSRSVYYETLPPGFLLHQLRAQGWIRVGGLAWRIWPDVLALSLEGLEKLLREGLVKEPILPYATNRPALLVAPGNPAGIQDLRDLGRPEVRVAVPEPTSGGLAELVLQLLRQAGGEELIETIYTRKVALGTTLLVHVHHREAPRLLREGRAEVGLAWQAEALHEERRGLERIELPSPQVTFAAAQVVQGAHPKQARAWLEFLTSPPARAILSRFGL